MEHKEGFRFTYSAARQQEVEHIRKKYLPQAEEENKMEQLRKLHHSASEKAQARAIAVGTIGALMLGIGMSLCANKVKGIRAACCSDYFSAKFTRLHNDANALCLGGRVVGAGLALEMVDVFLETEFEGGRHQRRVDQIMAIEAETFEG